MKVVVKRDQFVGSFLILVGIVYGVMTSKLDYPMTADYPGPKAFPYIGVFGLIVCGLGIFIQSALNKKPQAVFMVKEGWWDLIKSFVALLFYVIGLKYLGYLICTPLLLFVLSIFFAKTIKVKLLSRILFSVLVTGFVYVFYVFGFGMQLPIGSLFQ